MLTYLRLLITEGRAQTELLCIKICLSSFYLNFKENVNQFYFNKMTLSRKKKKMGVICPNRQINFSLWRNLRSFQK